MQKSNGLKGLITIKQTEGGQDRVISGMTTFEKSANSKNIIDLPTVFGKTRDQQILGTKQVTTVSFNGVFDLDDDDGQRFLTTAYKTKKKFYKYDIKLYVNIDENVYWTPDDNSYLEISSVDQITQSAEGFCTVEYQAIVHGNLELLDQPEEADYVVSGDITPDATGNYYFDGNDGEGHPTYKLDGENWFLWAYFDGVEDYEWVISQSVGTLGDVYWLSSPFVPTSPYLGTYYPSWPNASGDAYVAEW